MKENNFSSAMQEWFGVFASRTMRDFMTWTHDYGVNMPQISVLMRLYYRGPTSILAVRQELYGSRAAASQLVEKLVQMGLVERSEDAADRRVKNIRLTDHGRQMVEQGIAARRRWLTDLGEAFGPAEQEQFAGMLARLSQAARRLERREEQAASPSEEEDA
jgi:DNA-binding MarR family transcriptional regulator